MTNIFSTKKKEKEVNLSNLPNYDNNQNSTSIENLEEAGDEKTVKVNIGRYNDPEGLTLTKMAFGLWLLRNRRHFKFILIIFLIIISLFTWPRFIYTLGKYVLVDMKKDREMLMEMTADGIPAHEYFIEKAAQPIQTNNPQIFTNQSGLYDFFIKISNPNQDYVSNFSYYFKTDSNESTEKYSGYILPGETKYLMSLGQDINQKPNVFNLVFEDVLWKRINKHEYPDWEKFYSEHIKFEISEVKFVHAKESLLTEKYSLNELEFTIKNDTAYNYWETGFIILLLDNNKRIIAINRQLINLFKSGEKKYVKVTWPGKFASVNDVQIMPDVDIVNSENYINFESNDNRKK